MCDFPRARTTLARPSFSPLGYSVTSARTRSPGSAEKPGGRSTSRSRSDSRSRNRTKKRLPAGAYRPTNVRIPRSRIRSIRPYDRPPARRRSSRTSTRSLGHAPERECPGIRTMGVSGSAGITIGRPSRVKRRRPSTVRPPSAPRRSRGAPYGVPSPAIRPFPRRGGFFSRFPFTPSGFSAFSAALKARRSPFSTPASRYHSFTDARASSSAFGRCRSHCSQNAWSRIRALSFASKPFPIIPAAEAIASGSPPRESQDYFKIAATAGFALLFYFRAMRAEVAELADAPDSGSGVGNHVGVQIPPSAP